MKKCVRLDFHMGRRRRRDDHGLTVVSVPKECAFRTSGDKGLGDVVPTNKGLQIMSNINGDSISNPNMKKKTSGNHN